MDILCTNLIHDTSVLWSNSSYKTVFLYRCFCLRSARVEWILLTSIEERQGCRVYDMKAYKRSRYVAPAILNLSNEWRYVSRFMPRPLYSQEESSPYSKDFSPSDFVLTTAVVGVGTALSVQCLPNNRDSTSGRDSVRIASKVHPASHSVSGHFSARKAAGELRG
jgi:hypothetical protein